MKPTLEPTTAPIPLEMIVGEKKTIEIEPENAYGHVMEQLISVVDKTQVPMDVKVGDTLQGQSTQGPIVVTVIEVNENTITLDANHPLAGKKLIFDLEVMGIS